MGDSGFRFKMMTSLENLIPMLASQYGIKANYSRKTDGSVSYELITSFATKTLCISKEQDGLQLNDRQKKKLEVALIRYSKGFTNEVAEEIQGILVNDTPFTQEDLDQILRENAHEIQAENCILLVGQTRCGKTTILNFLAKCDMFNVQKNLVSYARVLGDHIVLEAMNPVGEIGHEESKTHAVKIITLKNVTIADGPGFGDTAGLSKEIPNALKLASIGKKLKGVIYCVKIEDINSQAGSRWITDLQNLKNFLGPNSDKYSKAIQLVITHIPPGTTIAVSDLQAVLKEYLENSDLLGDDHDLMQFRKTLLEGGLLDRITLLEKDDYCDPIKRKNKRKALLQDIANLTPKNQLPTFPFGISLSGYSRNKLGEGVRLCLEKTRTDSNEMHEAIKTHWQQKIDGLQIYSIDQLKEMTTDIAVWKAVNLDELSQLQPLITLFPAIADKLKNSLVSLKNLNELLLEADRLKIEDECNLAGIIQDIDRFSDTLNSTYVFKATLNSLKEVLESYEVQKDLLDPKAVLGESNQEIATLLDKFLNMLPAQAALKLPYLAQDCFISQLTDPAKKTVLELLLKDNIFEPFNIELHHKSQCINITLKSSKICLSKLLKMLGDITNTQDIIINGPYIYLDTHLKGDNFKNKSITFNVDKVKVAAKVQVKCGMIQMLKEIEGSLAFDESNQEWGFSPSGELKQGWHWIQRR